MAEIRPFRGLRYRVPEAEAGRVIAPPYDVISPRQQEALYDLSPFNIIRIEYPRGTGEERYEQAAATLRHWREERVLAPENAPALYLYEQVFSHGGVTYGRRGIFARLRLEPLEAGVVRPHEYTLAPAKADRLSLLRATRTNVSPILTLIDDANGAFTEALERGLGQPVMDAEDFTGQRHHLTVIEDPEVIDAVVAAVAGRPLYIADGHHRYETALTYRAERRSASRSWTGEEPENFVLTAITATTDPGLLILPIHRLVRPRRMPDNLLDALGAVFDLRDAGALDDLRARKQLVLDLAEAGENGAVFGAAGLAPGRLHLITLRDRASVERAMPAGHPPAWRALDVNVLQYGVLEPLLGIDAAALASGEWVTFTEDAEEAMAAVADGRVPLAFLLNATRPEEIIAVADEGDRMPQKSTFFYPKLGTGLVLNSFDAEAGE